MNKANWSHALAAILYSTGQILDFVKTTPELAGDLHLTSTVLTTIGFAIALASVQLFGTPTVPVPAPVFAELMSRVSAKGTQGGFVTVRAALAVLLVGPLALLVASLQGCTPAQTAAAVQTAEQLLGPGLLFGGCVWNTYQSIPAGTPALTYVAQEIAACGGDSATVLEALDQREIPAMHRPIAHAALPAKSP